MNKDQNQLSDSTSSRSNSQDIWYLNPMVWMIIALPLTVVIASMVTIGIAIQNAPTIVMEQAADAILTDSSSYEDD